MFGTMYAETINPTPNHIIAGCEIIRIVLIKIRPKPMLNNNNPVFVHNGQTTMFTPYYSYELIELSIDFAKVSYSVNPSYFL